MFHPLRAMLLAGLVVVLATSQAGAQDAAMPKDGMTKFNVTLGAADLAAGSGMMHK